MKFMKRIYIAGPLNATNSVDYIKNLHRMIIIGNQIKSLGFAVFIPGIDFLVGLIDGSWNYEDYFTYSSSWLEVADAMFVLPKSDKSNGVSREFKIAESFNIPIFYDIDELLEWNILKK